MSVAPAAVHNPILACGGRDQYSANVVMSTSGWTSFAYNRASTDQQFESIPDGLHGWLRETKLAKIARLCGSS